MAAHEITHKACLHEDRWDGICRQQAETHLMVKDIHQRLFIGNGTPATMTRIDRLERIAAVLLWVTSTVGGACIVAIVGIIVKIVKG
jgi:hypothetical protein